MSTSEHELARPVEVYVCDGFDRDQKDDCPSDGSPVVGATVRVFGPHDGSERGADSRVSKKDEPISSGAALTRPIGTPEMTDARGRCKFELANGKYRFETEAFGYPVHRCIDVHESCKTVVLPIPLGFTVETFVAGENCTRIPCGEVQEGQTLVASLSWSRKCTVDVETSFTTTQGEVLDAYETQTTEAADRRDYFVSTKGTRGRLSFRATLKHNPFVRKEGYVNITSRATHPISGDVAVTLRRAATEITDDIPLWVVIRKSAEALSFNNYFRFLNVVLCGDSLHGSRAPTHSFHTLKERRFLPFTDTDAYRLLKVATEAFVMVHCGVDLDDWGVGELKFGEVDSDYVVRRIGQRPTSLENLWQRYLVKVNGSDDAMLPYLALIRAKLADVPIKSSLFGDLNDSDHRSEACFGILKEKLTSPCFMELIWSYWHEEGMLVQTINAVARRFQNIKAPAELDPLGNLEVDPLRPLNNLLWGYIQDEQHRLSIMRRSYEYRHEYALTLEGKAVGDMRAADVRSKFLEAFHQLLHQCAIFYKQDDNTTIVADGFPVLNALKEVHLILSEAAHNQFGELPSTARIEMLMQQWLLARPEFREYLPTRIMVAYPEAWMDRVDAMKKLQGWTDTSVLHFRNLGVFGEEILLSIRYGAWSDVNDAAQAANWSRFWRPEIQGYTHAYRSVTGVDLTATNVGSRVDARLPSTLLRQQLAVQHQRAV